MKGLHLEIFTKENFASNEQNTFLTEIHLNTP